MSKALMKSIVKNCSGIGHMATIDGKSPKVRVMTFRVNSKNEFLTSTFTRSAKMKQLTANKRTAVSFWDPSKGMLIVSGTVSVIKDAAAKKRFYKSIPELKGYFSSADDPNYTLLCLKPKAVSIMPSNSMETIKVKL